MYYYYFMNQNPNEKNISLDKLSPAPATESIAAPATNDLPKIDATSVSTVMTEAPVIDVMENVEPISAINDETSNDGSSSKLPPIVPIDQPKNKKSKKLFFIILAIVLFLLVIFGGTGTVTVLAAYGKITLPNNYNYAARNIVQGLPFMPKSPDYVLEKMILSLASTSKSEFETNIKISLDEKSKSSLGIMFGLGPSELNMSLAGKLDTSDLAVIRGQFSFDFADLFAFEFAGAGEDAYVRLTKYPSAIINSFDKYGTYKGLDKIITNRWIKMEQIEGATGISDVPVANQLKDSKYDYSKWLEKITMKKEKVDGANVYNLDISMTLDEMCKLAEESKLQKEDPNACGEIPEENKDSKFNLSMSVDTNSYLPKNVVLSGDYIYPNVSSSLMALGAGSTSQSTDLSGNDNMKVTYLIDTKFVNFGDAVVIEIPSDAVDIEVIYQELTDLMSKNMQNSPMYSPRRTLMDDESTSPYDYEDSLKDDYSGFE